MSSGKDRKGKDKESSDNKKSSSKDSDSNSKLAELFEQYSKFGDRESDGSTLTTKSVDKWLKQAKILDHKSSKIKQADTAITFSRVAKTMKRLTMDQFQQFIKILAEDKDLEEQDLIDKLVNAGPPKTTNTTSPVTSGVAGRNLRRMTNPSLYTGAHKNRFDKEGKGLGIAGREDVADNTGYVRGFRSSTSQLSKKESKNGKEKSKKEKDDD